MSFLTSSIFLPATVSPCLLHVELDAVIHLSRGIGKLPRVGHDQADFHDILRNGRAAE